jgi:hypothetical protein
MKRIWIALAAAVTLAASAAQAAPPDPHAILADVGKVVSKNGIDEGRAAGLAGPAQQLPLRARLGRLFHGGRVGPARRRQDL